MGKKSLWKVTLLFNTPVGDVWYEDEYLVAETASDVFKMRNNILVDSVRLIQKEIEVR